MSSLQRQILNCFKRSKQIAGQGHAPNSWDSPFPVPPVSLENRVSANDLDQQMMHSGAERSPACLADWVTLGHANSGAPASPDGQPNLTRRMEPEAHMVF